MWWRPEDHELQGRESIAGRCKSRTWSEHLPFSTWLPEAFQNRKSKVNGDDANYGTSVASASYGPWPALTKKRCRMPSASFDWSHKAVQFPPPPFLLKYRKINHCSGVTFRSQVNWSWLLTQVLKLGSFMDSFQKDTRGDLKPIQIRFRPI